VRLLFVHQNFPGQYRHLAPWFAAQPGNQVAAVGEKANVLRQRVAMANVKLLGYDLPKLDPAKVNPFNASVLRAIHRGRTVARGAEALRRSGFRPDVLFTHLGWGEGLFLKDIFPEAKVLLYCEFFYRSQGGDVGFDPEFPANLESLLRLRVMNAPLLMALDAADWGFAPTRWQQLQFPAAYAERMTVVHDGVDTDLVSEDASARFRVPGTERTLTREDEVVTYVARNFEPYRGFHIFMRAIPEIQKRRPKARIVMVGGDEVSYSPRLPSGQTYRARMLREMEGRIDLSRLTILDRLPYDEYLTLLRVSSAHVYLTYPFVLSWSLIEALSAGCAVVASRTPPVEEVITHGENGLLAGFFSVEEIAARIDELLRDRERTRAFRAAARRTAVERYDLKRVCLPAQVKLVEDLAAGRLTPRPPGAGGR
jgi:glycosyltransferase involved in cell wall biosynthesis